MLQIPDRITLDRKAFIAAARIAHTGAQARGNIPALAAVKVTANEVCAFEATDLDQCVRTEIPYDGKPTELVIPNAESLAKAIGAVGGDTLALGERAGDKKRKLLVRSGEFAAELESLSVDDHVGIDRVAEEDWGVDIGADAFRQITRVMPAISTEKTRYYLNGICVHHLGDWTFRFAATDGHRLFVSDVALPGFTGSLPEGRIIPKRFWHLVKRHLGNSKDAMRLSYGPKVARNETDATLGLKSPIHRVALRGTSGATAVEVTTKLIDGNYPDYSRVIPKNCAQHLRVSRAALARAVNALQPLATEKTRAIKLTFLPDALRISLHSPTVGDCHIDIDAQHGLPADKSISFNASYLLDCCAQFTGDELTLSWTSSAVEYEGGQIADPTLLTDPADSTFFAVLMPMRV